MIDDENKTKKPEKEKSELEKLHERTERGCLIALIVICIIIGIGVTSCSIMSTGNSSKWDSLSDSEKAWYYENYGDGQYDEYRKAIDDYNANH